MVDSVRKAGEREKEIKLVEWSYGRQATSFYLLVSGIMYIKEL